MNPPSTPQTWDSGGALHRSPAQSALESYLGRPQLKRFWSLVRQELEDGGVQGRVQLDEPTADERLAIAGLLGLPLLPDGALELPLEQLDRCLRASRFAVGLSEAVTALGGPLRQRGTTPLAELGRWQALWDSARSHPVVRIRPRLGRWLDELAASGRLERLAPGYEEELLRRALEVFAALPGGGIRRSALAQQVLEDPHALDSGRPLASLVLRGLAALSKCPSPSSAAERQRLWQWAGVTTDDLTPDVLTLGLRPTGPGVVCHWLGTFAAAGEPARVTLRQLQSHDLTLAPGSRVFICQSPLVVAAAAERLGTACSPLICTGGLANVAVESLLTTLARAGTRLCYHGDFTWDGVRVANTLYRTIPYDSWRYGTEDYLSALEATADPPDLAGNPVYAVWDPQLSGAMADKEVAIEEEAVLKRLLEDLSHGR